MWLYAFILNTNINQLLSIMLQFHVYLLIYFEIIFIMFWNKSLFSVWWTYLSSVVDQNIYNHIDTMNTF